MAELLRNIQDTVARYAAIISRVLDVSVEIVDGNLFRLAGTGMFAPGVNRDMSSEGFVYRHVLQTRKRQVISDPGNDPLCTHCQHQNHCLEKFEISTPILCDGQVIGIIGLACQNEEEKLRLERKLDDYLDFLDQISDFIGIKAHEQLEAAHNRAMISMLDSVINKVDQGVLILGEEGEITTFNESARQQLHLGGGLLGRPVGIAFTGDTLGNAKEYKLAIDGTSRTVMGEIFSIGGSDPHYATVLLFTDSKKLHSQLYEMTSTVSSLGCQHIIGTSEQIVQLKLDIHKVARSSSTVLITGESGTGKELVATAIWQDSERKNQRFVAINCAAIPESLLESELFGYVKGAFTGADPNGKIGKFELAQGGVIFLDEIGDMPLHLQVKLLRVIQERKLMRIGSNQVIPVNVRIIAATNKDLRQMIEERKFREDLYYRLNVIPLHIPPLRERKEDIDSLVQFFIERYVRLFDKYYAGIDEQTMWYLREHCWAGNIRELENAVEFMVNMMEEDGRLTVSTLPKEIREAVGSGQNRSPDVMTLRELERREIAKALQRHPATTEGKRKAAKELGISMATLYRKLEQEENL